MQSRGKNAYVIFLPRFVDCRKTRREIAVLLSFKITAVSFSCHFRLTAVAEVSGNLQLEQLYERVAVISRLTAGTTDSTMSFRIRSVSSHPGRCRTVANIDNIEN